MRIIELNEYRQVRTAVARIRFQLIWEPSLGEAGVWHCEWFNLSVRPAGWIRVIVEYLEVTANHRSHQSIYSNYSINHNPPWFDESSPESIPVIIQVIVLPPGVMFSSQSGHCGLFDMVRLSWGRINIDYESILHCIIQFSLYAVV